MSLISPLPVVQHVQKHELSHAGPPPACAAGCQSTWQSRLKPAVDNSDEVAGQDDGLYVSVDRFRMVSGEHASIAWRLKLHGYSLEFLNPF